MGNCRLALLLIVFFSATATWGQSSDTSAASSATPTPTPTPVAQPGDDPHYASDNPVKFLRNLGRDQKDIWTSPFKARVQDLNWIVPLTGVSAGLINADAELSSRITGTSTLGKHASTVSNGGVALLLGGSGSLYLLGKYTGDEHKKETGIIAIEAATNSLIVGEVLKAVTQRARPTDGNFKGEFFNSSSISNSSFPSAHALLAWSAASVLAHEYPGPLSQVLFYGLATTVSAARVAGRDHFPSDVVVGSAMGWLMGWQAYKAHHNHELPGAGYGKFSPIQVLKGFPTQNAVHRTFLLIAGSIPHLIDLPRWACSTAGSWGSGHGRAMNAPGWLKRFRPRSTKPNPDEAYNLYTALAREFATELSNEGADYIGLDSVYARTTTISGPPLTDSYHFGQTIVNDYGRPYQRGTNGLAGFSSTGVAGALSFSVRENMNMLLRLPVIPRPCRMPFN